MANSMTPLSRVITAIRKEGTLNQTAAENSPNRALEMATSASDVAVSEHVKELDPEKIATLPTSTSDQMTSSSVDDGPITTLPETHGSSRAVGGGMLIESESGQSQATKKRRSTPAVSSNSVDIIIEPMASDTAIGDKTEDIGEKGNSTVDDQHTEETPTKDASGKPEERTQTSRRKRTAAKSVLEARPVSSDSGHPNQLELAAFESLIERRSKGVDLLLEERQTVNSSSVPRARSSSKSSPVRKKSPKKASKATSKHASPKKKSGKKLPSTGASKVVSKTVGESRSAIEIFSGVPTEKFDYSWEGWTKKTFERQSGKTKGSTDSYWYTPVNKYKLRSLVEIRRFNEFLEQHKDESKAWEAMKSRKS